MKKLTPPRVSRPISRRVLAGSLVAAFATAAGALSACDLRDESCEDTLVGARFVVTPSPDGRVVAKATVEGDAGAVFDAGAVSVADGAASVADGAAGDGAGVSSSVDAGDGSVARDSGADARARTDGGQASGADHVDDLSCAEICRLGFGPHIDVVGCDGPFRGEIASGAARDGGADTRVTVTYADCEGVATVCVGPEHRRGGRRHRSRSHE